LPPTSTPVQPTGNLLLDALTLSELALLAPERVDYRQGDVLCEADAAVADVYFPRASVVSVVTTLSSGETVESQTVGRDGFAGLSVFLGQPRSASRMIVQVADTAYRLDANRFRSVIGSCPVLSHILLGDVDHKSVQLGQLIACMAIHDIDRRCARWLLMIEDRVDSNTFAVTQEFMSQMLGVHRPTVSIAEHALMSAGLISRTRGHVTILDRPGLRAAACECYEAACLLYRPNYSPA